MIKKIKAEGDSWFAFPRILGTGGGIVDHLEDMLGQPITNMAHAGDETRAMLSLTDDQLPRLERELKDCDVLLFSGGGNDIAGEQLVTVLNDNTDGDVLKAINWDRLRASLAMTRAMYDDLFELRDSTNPNCIIITHEYDVPVPDGKAITLPLVPAFIFKRGPWLKPSLEWCGWRLPVNHEKIIHMILHEFAVMMRTLNKRNHIHCKTQGVLSRSDWHDEMHPNRAGFKKLASAIASDCLPKIK